MTKTSYKTAKIIALAAATAFTGAANANDPELGHLASHTATPASASINHSNQITVNPKTITPSKTELSFFCDAPDMSDKSFRDVVNHISQTTVRLDVKSYKVSIPSPGSIPKQKDENGEWQTISKPVALFTPQKGIGSGVILSKEGYLGTAYHVTDGEDPQITVTTFDENGLEQKIPAKIVNGNKSADYTLLKIDPSVAHTPLTCASFAEKGSFAAGDTVIVNGSPRGRNQSISDGIVSNENGHQEGIFEFVQTNADINPGNSGGGLYNRGGQIIGITSFIVTKGGGSEGLGYALSAKYAQALTDDYIRDGESLPAWTGATFSNLDNKTIEATGSRLGAKVSKSPDENTPAALAGLKEGDVITHIGSQQIISAQDAESEFFTSNPNTPMNLTVWSADTKKTHNVTIIPGNKEIFQLAATKRKEAQEYLKEADELLKKAVVIPKTPVSANGGTQSIQLSHTIK